MLINSIRISSFSHFASDKLSQWLADWLKCSAHLVLLCIKWALSEFLKFKKNINETPHQNQERFPFYLAIRRGQPCHLNLLDLYLNVSTWKHFWYFSFSSCNQGIPISTVQLSRQPLTCTKGGFQRRFFSGAGVKWKEPVGRFLSSSLTPAGFSRNFATRFFSCHPTLERIKTSFFFFFFQCCFP